MVNCLRDQECQREKRHEVYCYGRVLKNALKWAGHVESMLADWLVQEIYMSVVVWNRMNSWYHTFFILFHIFQTTYSYYLNFYTSAISIIKVLHNTQKLSIHTPYKERTFMYALSYTCIRSINTASLLLTI